MEVGSVWVSLPLHFAVGSNYADATQVSTIRVWVKPSLLVTVSLALVPGFGEMMVVFLTVFHSFPPSCLGKLVQGEQFRKKTQGAQLQSLGLPCSQASHSWLLGAAKHQGAHWSLAGSSRAWNNTHSPGKGVVKCGGAGLWSPKRCQSSVFV